ncbi:MAG: hypothetical protein MI867_22630 [Pseudomonadales bacterium]|nr:hypothetical protein [Pseudomonadales bacterium]
MDTWSGVDQNPHSLNKYNYTESNPANSIDPSGNAPTSASGALSASSIMASISSGYGFTSISLSRVFSVAVGTAEGYTARELGALTIATMVGIGARVHSIATSSIRENDEETIDLYRAIGDTEYLALEGTGFQAFTLGRNAFPKQFFHSEGEAKKFGVRDRVAECIKEKQRYCFFHIVKATISKRMYNSLNHEVNEPGIGPIVTVETSLLPAFNAEVSAHGGVKYVGEHGFRLR